MKTSVEETSAGTWERIEMIEKDDLEAWSKLIAEVSELIWGEASGEHENGDIRDPYRFDREPYSIAETIERLKEFSDKALAWDELQKELVA